MNEKEIKKKQQSDSQRHVGLGQPSSQVKSKDKDTLFSFCKILLRQTAVAAQKKCITTDEWKKIHANVLVDAVHKYTPEQQKVLQEFVAKATEDIAQHQQNVDDIDAPSPAVERNNLIAHFQGACKQKVINESQFAFLSGLLSAATTVAEPDKVEEDAAIDEMKAVLAIFGDDFKYMNAEFEERAEDITHSCVIKCRTSNRNPNDKDPMWLEVSFQFGVNYPSAPPRISFVESNAIKVAELAVLDSLLVTEAQRLADQNKLCVTEIAKYVSKYLDHVAASRVSTDPKANELPYIPKGLPLTEYTPQNKNTEFENMTLADLDKTLCTAVQNALAKTPRLRENFEISHIENIISPAVFKNFRAKLIDFNTRTEGGIPYAPVISYHGTCTPNNVRSISKSGLVSAGEYTPDGKYINIRHGSVYGCGIYSSPNLETAKWYTFTDSQKSFQLFVSLTTLGTPHQIKNFDEIFENRLYDSLWPIKGSDSHVSPLGNQFIVFESAQILPVLLVTFTPIGTPSLEKRLKVQLDTSGSPVIKKESEMSKWKRLKLRERMQQAQIREENSLIMYRVPGSTMHWAMSFTENELKRFSWASLHRKAPEIRLTLLLDKSESMGSTFAKVALPGCAQLYQTLKPNSCNLILFGRTVDVFTSDKITSARFFESPAVVNTKLEDATDILGGYKKAIEIALRDQEQLVKECEDEFFETKKAQFDALKKVEKEEAEKQNLRRQKRKEELIEVNEDMSLKETAAYAREFRRHPKRTNVLHIFILMSDGEDTINDQMQVDKVLWDHHLMLNGCGAQAIFKVVGIGKNSDTHLAMQMKLATQTVKVWESTPVYYVRRPASLAAVIGTVCEDLNKVLESHTSNFYLSLRDEYVIGEGFVVNLTNRPVHDISIKTHESRRTCVLFKGVPPRELSINGSWFPTPIYLLDQPRLDQIGIQASILDLLSSLVSDIKIAIVAGRDVTHVVKEVRDMVEGVKNASFNEQDLMGSTPAQRVETMRNKKRLVTELAEILNTLEDTINLGKSKMSSDQQALWLNQVANMKYGAQSLRRAAKTKVDIGAIVKGLQDIKRKVDSETLKELPTDPRSSVSGLAALGHLREIPNEINVSGITDLLYSYGITGVGIQVVRSEAAVADPWKISVTYLSKDCWDTTSAMCGLHAMATHKDTAGRVVQDVLVILDPRNPAPYKEFVDSPLYAAYMGVIFARNPDIQLPAQRSAILISALVRGITQLLEPAFRTREFLAVMFKLVYTVRFRIMKKGETSEYWNAMLKKLIMSQPGKWMTEAPEDDIGSVAKLLGVLCCAVEKVKEIGLFNNTTENRDQLAEVSLALLAETSSRGARIKIKGIIEKERLKDLTAKPPAASSIVHEVLMDALRLVDNAKHPDPNLEVTDPPITHHDNSWNLERATKKSGNFFYTQVNAGSNNCPPQSVLACLTFAAALASAQFEDLNETLAKGDEATLNKLYDHVLLAFEGVSMKNFIQRYICYDNSHTLAGTPVDLQVALYVQGTKYYNSQTRRQGLPSLLKPKDVVSGIASDERGVQYEIELAAKLKQVRKINAYAAEKVALAEKARQQALFMAAHSGLPKIFGYGEVAELNRHRPAEDQLERLETGLLKHHCCFPTCPQYLKNLCSDKDRVLGRRSGLYKHFKYLVHPAKFYMPHFHLVACTIVKRDPHVSLEVFTNKFLEDVNTNNSMQSAELKKELIETVWKVYRDFYNSPNP